MNLSLIILNQIFVMFVLMSIGFLFYKINFISAQGSKDMGKILLYLVIPVVIVKNFLIERSSENIQILVQSIGISLVCMIISIIVSYLFFGKKDGVATFASSFANAGFIGMPLVEATLGSKAVLYVSIIIIMINILQWTYGIWLMTQDKSVMQPKKILTNPILIAVLIGVLLFSLQIQLPKTVITIFNTIGGLNTPLAMMVLGVYLAQADLLSMIKNINIYKVATTKLFIIPLVTLAVFSFLPIGNAEIKLTLLIATACPVGANTAIFAQAYNKDYKAAVEQVCVSTILCLITIPIIVSISTGILF